MSELGAGSYLGAYQLLEQIGQGAIGLVYLAEHTKLRRRVAIKLLRDELAANAKAVARFFGEARAVNEIAHEHIVEITDFVEGDLDRGLPNYYIMELLDGRTVKDALAAGPLAIDHAIEIAVQIADALAAVHEKRIIHRDLKPANIFLVSDEKRIDFVKLLDFGVAKLSSAFVTGQPDTGSGMIVGTPGYMAPEQIRGDAIDGRTDLYALGVVLFEMVTGRAPFTNPDMLELLYQHCDDRPPNPEEMNDQVPRALGALILQCLAKEADERPRNALEVHQRLRALQDRRSLRRRLVPASWVAAGAAGVIAVLGLGGASGQPPVVLVEEVATETALAHAAVPIERQHAAAPNQISVRFASDPEGAQVFLGAEAIGQTPFARTFARSDDHAQVTFRLPGHREEVEVVSLAADAVVKVGLKEKPKKRPAKRRVDRISKADLRNPFQ